MVFKSVNVLEKTVESCTLEVLPLESKIRVLLTCKYSVTRLYTFPFLESETLTSEYEMAQDGSSFTCQAQVLNDAALNFLKNQEEVTMTSTPDRLVMKNYISSESRDNLSTVHTELTMHPNEFEAFVVNSESSLTYCLKELRAIIAFADAFTLPLTSVYGTSSANPIYFNLEHPGVLEGSLVMATMVSDEPLDANSTFNSSQASSFRSTEDLLRRNRPYTKRRSSVIPRHPPFTPKPSTPSFQPRPSTSSHVDEDPFNFNESQESVHPKTSTMNLHAPPPPNFSQGIIGDQDLLDSTEAPICTPPSKRARFLFKRCFEKTVDVCSIPGTNNVLAPDSDGE